MRKFLIIWFGQLISVIGSGMVSFGLGVWIFRETGSVTTFGITVFIGMLPQVVLSPLAGVLADRYSRRLIMILSDSVSALVSVALFLILMFGDLRIEYIYALSFFSAIGNTFQSPAYQASIPMLVSKSNLGRANGLMQSMYAISALLPPILGGLTVGYLGLSGILIIDLVTFGFAVASLLCVSIPMPEKADSEEISQKQNIWKQMIFGFHYLSRYPGLIGLLSLGSLINFLLNMSMIALIAYVLSFSSELSLGIVQSFGGVGMLTGSIIIGVVGTYRKVVPVFVLSLMLSGLGMIIMGLQTSVFFASAGLAILMFSIPVANSHSAIIWQTKIPLDKQGRIAATRRAISQLLMPLGSLAAGPLADGVFAPLSIEPGRGVGYMYIASGITLIIVMAIGYAIPFIRNLERDLPDVVTGEEIDAV